MDEVTEPIVRFAAATNRSIAGSAARVADDVLVAPLLRRVLRDLDARTAGDADLVIATDVNAAVRAAPERSLDRAPVVVVQAGGAAWGAGRRVVRSGVLATDRPDVVVVPVGAVPSGAGPRSAVADSADRIAWARRSMPVSRTLAAELAPLAVDRRIGLSLVLEPKTAVLALLLADAGSHVSVFAFADETDDAVAAVLRERGIAVHASATATANEERALALALLDDRPEVLVDDGAHVLRLAHAERPEVVSGLIGASEETTSGLTPLHAMAADGALGVPVLAANDARSKAFFDNRHGTGESCALALATELGGLARVRLALAGFGPVGEGVAQAATALGAEVSVADIDPVRALAARFAGYEVGPLAELVGTADVVVSATGAPGTIDAAVIAACADRAAMAVAGGAPGEVDLAAVEADGRLRLIAGGGCVNIVAGEGNPIEVMDLSFGVQLGAIRTLLERGGSLAPGVHRLDPALDAAVAALAVGRVAPLSAVGATTDWRRTRFDPPPAAPVR